MDTDKEQKRKERLAKWKASQAAKNAAAAGSKSTDSQLDSTDSKIVRQDSKQGPRPLIAKPRSAAKKRPRLTFDESEENPVKKTSFIEASFHAAGNDVTDDKPPVDSLDAFMSTLENGAIDEPIDKAFELEAVSDEETLAVEPDNPEDPRAYMEALDKKQRKTIPEIDHSKMNYKSFRKKFFVPEESDDVDSLRTALGLVVKNSDIGPISDWSQAGLPRPLMEVIERHNFEQPTPVQAQALPIIMNGRDVVSVAQTGSGKTISYLLPLLRHVLDQPHANGEGPIAVVLSPTRELCVQIHAEMGPFLKNLGLGAVCAYGGSPVKEQIDMLKRGSPIVVATPGRMIDLLAANNGRVTNLSRTTFVVIDEADRMFDMGFEPQVKRILDNVRPDRQTVLFSATFSKPMERHAMPFLTDPAHIQVGLRSRVSSDVEQRVEILPMDNKSHKLLQILGHLFQDDNGTRAQAVVFVEKQDHADELAQWLSSKGYDCASLHGGKDQAVRDATIKAFKLGKLTLLVATSVAARGLDIKNLKLVVNYDPPSHLEDYVHRVGRTGRAGEKGVAVTFLSPDQTNRAHDVVRALKMSHQAVPPELQKMDDEFNASLKKGTAKVHGGFGGKGLERLESKRDTLRAQEKDTLQPEARDSEEPQASSHEPTPLPPTTVQAGPAPGVKGPATAKFHAMLDINDYPQAARLAVTSYGNQNKVIDNFGVSITARGQFVAAGQSGDKLKLAIEGSDEASVAGALQTLSSLLREGIAQASKAGGRYKVQ